MGKRDFLKSGLPLCVGTGVRGVRAPLTPERIAEMDAQSKRFDELDAASPYFVNGEFVEPEDDPDGFDRRMTGV